MIRVTVYSDQPIKDAANRIAKEWEKQARRAWKYAKTNVPYDTGRLSKSHRLHIRPRAGGYTITCDTGYDVYVHDGTRKMAGRPWLENAVQQAVEEIYKLLPHFWISVEKEIT